MVGVVVMPAVVIIIFLVWVVIDATAGDVLKCYVPDGPWYTPVCP